MKLKEIKANKIFTIFFAMFFTLYKFPIVQIILFLLLGIYVLNDFIKKRKNVLKINTFKNISFLLMWFGMFVFYVIASKTWAIGTYPESRTIMTLLRMLYVGMLVFLYCDSKEKAISVMKSYVYGVLIMCIVVFILTPPTLYGVEAGDNFFGKVINQHRNTIGGAAAEAILYTCLISKISKFKYNKILVLFYLFVIFISGSRGALVELTIFIIIYALMNMKKRKFYKYIPVFLSFVVVSILILYNIPYLYDKFVIRIFDMINTIIYNTATDGSTYSRSLMKQIAYAIFKTHPIFGAGLDGVEVYLMNYPIQFGRNFRSVYSHCNYTELAANFGTIGLFIWYFPILVIIRKIFKIIKQEKNYKILLAIFIAILFIDNYKIPWSSDVEIFSYFTIMITILILNNEYSFNNGKKIGGTIDEK